VVLHLAGRLIAGAWRVREDRHSSSTIDLSSLADGLEGTNTTKVNQAHRKGTFCLLVNFKLSIIKLFVMIRTEDEKVP